MKTIQFTFVLLLFIGVSSCTKRKEIIYPQEMFYGLNINSIDYILDGEQYSFGAVLGKKADLKIVFTNTSTNTMNNPSWGYGGGDGITATIYDYNVGVQTFRPTHDGEVFTSILFTGSPGSCRIDYYENSDEVTNSKILTW